jgi:putative transposase
MRSMIRNITRCGRRNIESGSCVEISDNERKRSLRRFPQITIFEIDIVEIAEDHVHIFLSFPPRYSISKVVGMFKSISASVICREHPEVKRELWGGEFWKDGYFARTVGDKVTAEVIRNYIRYHREQEKSPTQLKLF